jgi:hypothetical protein
MGVCNACGRVTPGGAQWCEDCYGKGHGDDVIAKIVVGWDVDTDMRLESRAISGRHALFELHHGGRLRITDLKSTNGVYVNNVKVQTATVCPGDSVRLGSIPLEMAEVDRLLAKSKARIAREALDGKSARDDSPPPRQSSPKGLLIGGAVSLAMVALALVVAFGQQESADDDDQTIITNVPGLPPDPGEAGKRNIRGIDSDGDGLRDDLQRYIAIEFEDSPPTRQALTQVAGAQQRFLTVSMNEDRARQAAMRVVRGVECLYSVQGGKSREILNGLNAHIVNTPERLEAFFATEKHLGGQTFPIAPANDLARSCADPTARRQAVGAGRKEGRP